MVLEPDQPPPRAARRWTPVVVLLVATVVLGGVSLVLNRLAADGSGRSTGSFRTAAGWLPEGGSTVSSRAYICAREVRPEPVGPDSCQRTLTDELRRAPLTAGQLLLGDDLRRRVIRATAAVPYACRGGGGVCPTPTPLPTRSGTDPNDIPQPAPQVPAATAAQLIRAGLHAAGFTDVLVRVARFDDPAPAGTAIYAVGSGALCLVSYHGMGGGYPRIVGRLPGGACLAP